MEERRFVSFENSIPIYRTKTAMFLGVVYFSKGYQSNPVFAIQFANVSDGVGPDGQKMYDWNTRNTFYFTSYSAIWDFCYRWKKWLDILEHLKKNNVSNEEIVNKYKDMADKMKISNPMKKTTIYIMPSCYEGKYLLRVTFSGIITVTVTDVEARMINDYLNSFLKLYHGNCITHRIMGILYRSFGRGDSPRNELKNGMKERREVPYPAKSSLSESAELSDESEQFITDASDDAMIFDDDVPF